MFGLILQISQESSAGTDWPEALIAIGGITMITVIVGVAIWQVLASWRARMSVAREEAYRKLADESVALHRQLVDQQSSIARDLAGLSDRVGGIERLLKEVG